MNRKLFRIILQDEPFEQQQLDLLLSDIQQRYGIDGEEARWLLIAGKTSNQLYNPSHSPIRVLHKNGSLTELQEVSQTIGLAGKMDIETRHFICFPKELIFKG